MTVKTLETIDRLLQPLRLRAGWHYLSYDARDGRGYAAITWMKDATPWLWSWENQNGLWSLAVHIPGFQFEVIGPFELGRKAEVA